jgi:uncharacterized pyridoxal phosphate-containing UPF0001 family protein
LQTNKVRDAVALFDVIQSVDRERLAAVLAREMGRQLRRPACFIQVNTGEEPQKAGVLPSQLDAFIIACRDMHKLPVARPDVHSAGRRGAGAALRSAGQDGGAQRSSPRSAWGMSADYETAVRLGATHVRVGSALFGARAQA